MPASDSACSGAASLPRGAPAGGGALRDRQEAAFRLHKEPGPGGFAIEVDNDGEVISHSEPFDKRLVEALPVVESLVRSPEALANGLEPVGPVALERARAVLEARILWA
jgi:hypothetical protein